MPNLENLRETILSSEEAGNLQNEEARKLIKKIKSFGGEVVTQSNPLRKTTRVYVTYPKGSENAGEIKILYARLQGVLRRRREF